MYKNFKDIYIGITHKHFSKVILTCYKTESKTNFITSPIWNKKEPFWDKMSYGHDFSRLGFWTVWYTCSPHVSLNNETNFMKIFFQFGLWVISPSSHGLIWLSPIRKVTVNSFIKFKCLCTHIYFIILGPTKMVELWWKRP